MLLLNVTRSTAAVLEELLPIEAMLMRGQDDGGGGDDFMTGLLADWQGQAGKLSPWSIYYH